MTPPTTGVIEIERGGDENITINHGCGGGDCGGGRNSGGDGGDGGGRESDAALAAAGPMTMETMKTTAAVTAEAKASTSRQ